MKHFIKQIMIAGGLLMGSAAFAQVNYANLEWVDQSPVVGDTYFHTSSIVSGGNLFVTSNVLDEAGDTDILLIKYGTEGDTLWSSTFDGSAGGDDYGIELTTYSGSYIYVAGAVENTTSGYDYAVLMYDASDGSLEWSYTYDGTQGGTDIPSDILVDDNGKVYVCGGVEDQFGYSDFGVIRVDDSGNLDWEMSYDDNELYDAATAMEFIEGGDVSVTGGSNYESGVWNAVVLELDPTDGSIISEVQSTSTSVAFLEVTAMTTDADNNLYLTGHTQGTDKDVHTVKFDSTLTVDWVVDYDGGNDDEGNDVKVDASGNVYVVGYTERDSGGYNYLTLKYNSNGNLDWSKELGNATPTVEYATAEKLVLDNQANIYLTGTVEQGNESSMSFVKYDTDGNIELYRKYETQNVYDRSYDINYYGNAVYITGLSHSTATGTLTVLKYELTEREMNTTQFNGEDAYIEDELIVKFNANSVIDSVIDNKRKIFGELDEFVKADAIDSLNEYFPSTDWNRVKTYKIFRELTTNDTVSITRMGTEYEMPAYWAVLLLEVPNENPLNISLSMQDSVPDHIIYAQVNELYSLTSNDTLYSQQHNLYDNNYPDADINVDTSWYYETGKDNILVGVYDSGVRWSHFEFDQNIDPVDGKVRGGKDYYTGNDLSSIPDNGDPIVAQNYSGHGTKVAGIIGALKDNEAGIAGIAGGYWPYAPDEGLQGDPDPSANKGVSIYGFRVVTGGVLSVDATASALVEGSANSTNGYGYGLHILNCSFKKNINELNYDTLKLMHDAQQTVFRNGSVLVAGKGNNNNESKNTPSYSLKEFEVISVGGSDTSGFRHPNSDYGNGMDFLAPYSSELIQTTDNSGNDDYSSFNGTSASTPHASGVAGLMLSYINDQSDTPNNLFPDDVNFLMKQYAYDIAGGPFNYPTGYDSETGWGLLDAGNIFEHIKKDEYVIKHYFKSIVFDTLSTGYCLSNPCYTAASTLNNYADDYNPLGNYKGDVWEISTTNSHTLNTGDSILNAWPLNSYTNGLQAFGYTTNDRPQYHFHEDLASYDNNSAHMKVRTIHIQERPNGDPCDFWWPFWPGDTVKFGYTLHFKSDYANVEEEDDDKFNLLCYPNPTTGDFNIVFELDEAGTVDLKLFDINGRQIRSIEKNQLSAGQHNIKLNVNSLANGVYFVQLSVNNKNYHEKIIKK